MTPPSSGRDPRDLLEEMVDELVFLDRATQGVDIDTFLEDEALRRAFERSLEILGEASKAIPATTVERHAGIPWTEMARMRDLLIHAYHRVDPRIVWRTVHDDALPLLPMLRRVLADEEERRRP